MVEKTELQLYGGKNRQSCGSKKKTKVEKNMRRVEKKVVAVKQQPEGMVGEKKEKRKCSVGGLGTA